MTTTFFLVRHAAHDNLGAYLAGRMPGVRLGEAGLAQAGRLAKRMSAETFAKIVSSPRERACETASAIAEGCLIDEVEVSHDLDEVDFGDWSGKSFDELNQDPAWRRWNDERGAAETPAGETMEAVQRRMVGRMASLAAAFPDTALVLVSHADVIRMAVCEVLGLSISQWPRFEVSPASITTVVAGGWGSKLLGLNEVVH